MQTREFLRPADVARLLEVAHSTVRRWMQNGQLKAFRTPGGQWRIRRADAEALLPRVDEAPAA